jgi:hypothetical protein
VTYSSDRLDRMEALLASTIEGLSRTEKIVESNARAIEAWGDRIEEGIAEAEEVTSQQTANLAVRIEDNAHNQGIDRVRFDALHEEHTQRFNNLLEEARADRVRSDQLHAEHSQRFDVFLAEARADRAEMRAAREQADRDRALNEAEHRAFRETFQTMLAQIAQLWQRVG